MGNKLETSPEEPISEGKCCHYWIIEPPQGPTSRGVCKFCGAVKEFDSYGPESWSLWDRDTSASAEPLGAGLPDIASDQEQDDS